MQNNENTAVAEPTQSQPVFTPATDIIKTKEGFTVISDVPGVTLENVDIELENRELTITAVQDKSKHDNTQCIRQDYGVGMYRRAFSIPAEINRDGIKATLIDGVLTITLPLAEAVKPRSIPITAS
ncbi:MAG: Hsp20/alpha crystallin family protein [Spartobacteria bacterium]|nr:Hsp20/alpha crystallin family protein [Spartobacteria bacterium]